MTQTYNTLIASPFIAPECGRIEIQVPAGLTISDVVGIAFPRHPDPQASIRVVLVSDENAMPILPELWEHVRSKPGVQIILRPVPGKDALGSILSIVVSVAAVAFAPAVAGFLGLGAGKVAIAATTVGLSVVGQLLVSALIPAQTTASEDVKETFSINGWQNEMRPGGVLPLAFGKARYAPPFAARSYTEIVGDEQYIRALFTFGYGPVRLSDLRIGDTSVDDYEDIEIEIREGEYDDLPVTLYPQQVIEDAHGVDLVRPFARDTAGELLKSDPTIETPVVRFTASNSTEASVLLGFNSGLFTVNDDGTSSSLTVSIRICARLNGEGDWEDVTTLDIKAKNRASFVRQHTWTLPTRGRWQVEVTRMTDERTSTRSTDTVQLTALQSRRPEYPINLDKPLALVAVRVRATYQLNGGLDSFNVLVERKGSVYEGGEWVDGYGRTPATAYLAALTGPSNPFPVSVSAIDMDQIADWHDWCVEKGLKYDRIHDQAESLAEQLTAICAAGRATFRHDGVKWGVVIDRPETLVIDHISPRNSDGFSWSRGYFDPPDGFRVRFLDETNEYEEAERIIPWPGFEGDIKLTEELVLLGKTDPDKIWIEARRRMYELLHRSDTFTATQEGAIRVATRGDLLMGSFDVLDEIMMSAVVRSVHDNLIILDDEVVIEEGYGLRFKAYEDEDDLIGVSTVRGLEVSPDSARSVRLSGSGTLPAVDEVVHLGPVSTESIALRLKGVEAG